jgi:GNAT superfamily N-acetyltransferase
MDTVEADPRHPGTLWVRNLDWPLPENIAPRVPATFRCVGPVEIESLAQVMRLDDPATIEQRFAAGKRCYVAQVDGALATYGWVSFEEEEIGEIRLRIHLMPGEAYIWDCSTAPPYRRKRLYTTLLLHMVDQLRAEGLCRVWIGTDGDNVASQQGIALAGFRPVADLLVTRVIGIRRFWVRGRDGIPESIVSDARRALLGDRDQVWLAALSAVQRDVARSARGHTLA